MNTFSNYLIKNFSISFLPIFSSLFLITSIIFFIQISVNTSYLTLSFVEILQLYSFYIPEIFLYTLPVSFFSAMIVSLSKLSFDLELIVFFALGGDIKKILKPFFLLALLISTTLLIIGLWLKPKAMFKSKELIYNKEDSVQFNLKPSEYGQRFGSWLLHIGDKQQDTYKNIVLFSKKKDLTLFIKANKSTISQKDIYFI